MRYIVREHECGTLTDIGRSTPEHGKGHESHRLLGASPKLRSRSMLSCLNRFPELFFDRARSIGRPTDSRTNSTKDPKKPRVTFTA